ncbi:glycoside hydrolase family 127 protein [Paenibacillus sp. PAMC21692]|uniref:glycoside hydrolase family 127 protein n=1 Tax=Paenibacillus sp. PAMC21692 TaxID=2762320 RepID=UPI00164E613C|nr:beta-L-arabinofuranosidase domain-containing protein [Paenibacillus sp. PAMC21692]QNK59792.1 glycoside hydrolase family 127 protein [Paenibacillus sp. PAMC21692]
MAGTNRLFTPTGNNVKVDDVFWNGYRDLVRNVVVPYQWEALNDRVEGAEPSRAVRNMKAAAGELGAEFSGFVFQDSDLYKWLEAVGYLLRERREPELEAVADELIATIERAQEADGYLNTFYALKEPGKRFTNLTECHELYCAGHLMEAAVSYYEATGKTALLDIACRFADLIGETFGNGPGQIPGYDGHQEVELALAKLARATGNDGYMALARYFIDERGNSPSFFEAEADRRGRTTHWHKGEIGKINHAYFQAHLPVREQSVAIGHAVRVVYMCAGMADVAKATGDVALAEACERLWRNITERQMYVTGGIGATAAGEAFTVDYDLPNDTAYAETCASIGLIFFAKRMMELNPKGEFADVMERALYNTVLAGMAQDGRSFFYVNPLEAAPHVCEGGNPGFNHVKPVRQEWFGCACCPPNIARLLASLGDYAYTIHGDVIYSNLFIGGEAAFDLSGGSLGLKQRSSLPWSGETGYEIKLDGSLEFELAIRMPGWSPSVSVRLNGETLSGLPVENGFIRLRRQWQDGDVLDIVFVMPVQRVRSHPLVRYNVGKIALQRGPLVYCLEEADNGSQLGGIMLAAGTALEAQWGADLLGGIMTVQGAACRLADDDSGQQGWGSALYRADESRTTVPASVTFIPYYAWANRGKGEMAVWIKELAAQA